MSTTPFVPPDLNYYLGLVTSAHNQKPKFMATVAAEVQPFVDLQATLAQIFNGLFNVQAAVGDQLDKIGAWVGASRNLAIALPPSGITVLQDSDYRQLLLAVIAANNWDGTVPGMYAIWATVFGQAFDVLVQDNQDMTMFVVLLASTFSAVALALLTNGYFDLRPAGVRMLGYFQPSVQGQPVFGLGIEDSEISGLGVGYMVQQIEV